MSISLLSIETQSGTQASIQSNTVLCAFRQSTASNAMLADHIHRHMAAQLNVPAVFTALLSFESLLKSHITVYSTDSDIMSPKMHMPV